MQMFFIRLGEFAEAKTMSALFGITVIILLC